MYRCAGHPRVLCSGAVKPAAHYVRVLYHSSARYYCVYLRRGAGGYFLSFGSVFCTSTYAAFVRTPIHACFLFPVTPSSAFDSVEIAYHRHACVGVARFGVLKKSTLRTTTTTTAVVGAAAIQYSRTTVVPFSFRFVLSSCRFPFVSCIAFFAFLFASLLSLVADSVVL